MKQTKPRTVEVFERAYQPIRGELCEDLWLKGTFEEAMTVPMLLVKVRKVMSAKR